MGTVFAIPGAIQRLKQSYRLDGVTMIPPESALNALILLVVHGGAGSDSKGASIGHVKVDGEKFTFPRPIPVDVSRIPEVCEFAALESTILQADVDSDRPCNFDEHKLAT